MKSSKDQTTLRSTTHHNSQKHTNLYKSNNLHALISTPINGTTKKQRKIESKRKAKLRQINKQDRRDRVIIDRCTRFLDMSTLSSSRTHIKRSIKQVGTDMRIIQLVKTKTRSHKSAVQRRHAAAHEHKLMRREDLDARASSKFAAAQLASKQHKKSYSQLNKFVQHQMMLTYGFRTIAARWLTHLYSSACRASPWSPRWTEAREHTKSCITTRPITIIRSKQRYATKRERREQRSKAPNGTNINYVYSSQQTKVTQTHTIVNKSRKQTQRQLHATSNGAYNQNHSLLTRTKSRTCRLLDQFNSTRTCSHRLTAHIHKAQQRSRQASLRLATIRQLHPTRRQLAQRAVVKPTNTEDGQMHLLYDIRGSKLLQTKTHNSPNFQIDTPQRRLNRMLREITNSKIRNKVNYTHKNNKKKTLQNTKTSKPAEYTNIPSTKPSTRKKHKDETSEIKCSKCIGLGHKINTKSKHNNILNLGITCSACDGFGYKGTPPPPTQTQANAKDAIRVAHESARTTFLSNNPTWTRVPEDGSKYYCGYLALARQRILHDPSTTSRTQTNLQQGYIGQEEPGYTDQERENSKVPTLQLKKVLRDIAKTSKDKAKEICMNLPQLDPSEQTFEQIIIKRSGDMHTYAQTITSKSICKNMMFGGESGLDALALAIYDQITVYMIRDSETNITIFRPTGTMTVESLTTCKLQTDAYVIEHVNTLSETPHFQSYLCQRDQTTTKRPTGPTTTQQTQQPATHETTKTSSRGNKTKKTESKTSKPRNIVHLEDFDVVSSTNTSVVQIGALQSLPSPHRFSSPADFVKFLNGIQGDKDIFNRSGLRVCCYNVGRRASPVDEYAHTNEDCRLNGLHH